MYFDMKCGRFMLMTETVKKKYHNFMHQLCEVAANENSSCSFDSIDGVAWKLLSFKFHAKHNFFH